MTTNILQLLHTTAAYQSAVMQLLVNEANFAAKNLDLGENVPAIVATDTNRFDVEAPPEGVGGSVESENYLFWFHEGKLRSISKRKWLEKVSPPAMDVRELADRPSLLDTNSAYELAKERLAALSVDVAALEKKHPPRVFQLRARKEGPDGRRLPGPENLVAIPLFMIGWGEDPMNPILQQRMRELNRPMPQRPPSPQSPVFVEILGTTRELIELSIKDPSILTRPALQLANAADLLGPTPSPDHFVEELFGGKEARLTLSLPDTVEVWLLTSHSENDFENKPRTGAVLVPPETARKLSGTLLAFNSYQWGVMSGCLPDFGARLRFSRGADVVEIRLCYDCDIMEITHAGQTKLVDFDPSHNAFVRALQAIFPGDAVVKGLKLQNSGL